MNSLTRWDLARADTQAVSTDVRNFHLLATMLLRAVGDIDQMVQVLQPTAGLMPRVWQQYHAMVTRIRQMGHIVECHLDNIGHALNKRGSSTHLVETEHIFVGETNKYSTRLTIHRRVGSRCNIPAVVSDNERRIIPTRSYPVLRSSWRKKLTDTDPASQHCHHKTTPVHHSP